MTSAKYINLLEGHILPFKDYFSKYKQDNAPCHKSKTVNFFFSDNGIEFLPWLARSPDLNPIENVWAVLKKEVNLQDLGKAI